MKTKISRRRALAGLLASVAATTVMGATSTSTPARHRKVQWVKLKDESVGPGDMWSSVDPNQPERQAENGYNLQMQAVHPTEYGTPAEKVGHFSGDYWRPVGLVDC